MKAASLSKPMIAIALLLWLVAAIIGTVGQSVQRFDREAFFSLDGEPVDRCIAVNRRAVEADPAVADQWCTPSKVLGPAQPGEVEVHVGDILWENVGPGDFGEALGQPGLWFTLGVGGSALLVFAAFTRATGTLRAGLAAAVSIVFLGLLLFPSAFTAQIPTDMRTELVAAWKWVIAFYFGSEAAVQAWRITQAGSVNVKGDMSVPDE